jgi:phenylacetic acid degradation operon negative regulatory protein
MIVANNTRMVGQDGPAMHPGTMTPRSIVLSLLLGSHPPRMHVGRILQFTSLFGLSDGAVRTALSRMVAAGDLDNADGVYRLTSRLVERQVEQDRGRDAPPATWDWTWWSVTVLPDRRPMAERRAFRTRATGARLGELRPDVWLRPANIELPAGAFERDHEVIVTRSPLFVGDDHELARRLWDVDALTHTAVEHLDALDRSVEQLDRRGDDALADAFTSLAAAQRFLRTEPQLPAELDPPPESAAVRTVYGNVVGQFQRQLAGFFTRHD